MIALSCSFNRDNFAINIDETIPSSGITAIFGRSGAGKTTLIHLISGLLRPDQGLIRIKEQLLFDSKNQINLAPEKRQIGFVFQDARLFPHLNVEKNLRYGQGTKNKINFDEIIDILDIRSLLHRYPNALSGGEKQRVAIGRALLSNPNLLIMDEPTASLDLPRQQELINYLLKLTNTLSIPMLYVSHSLDEILQLADHLLLLDKGKVIENGAILDVWKSQYMLPWFGVKELCSLVSAKVIQKHPNYPLTKLAIDGQALWVPHVKAAQGTLLRLRIFASDISIAKTQPLDSSVRNIIPVSIIEINANYDKNNGLCRLTLRINKQTLQAIITQWAFDDLQLKENMMVFAQLKGVSITKQDLAIEPAA